MAVHRLTRFCVQEDWNDVLIKGGGKTDERVWIEMKRHTDVAAVRGSLIQHSSTTTSDKFTIESLAKNKLTVKCEGERCAFVAAEQAIKLHDQSIMSCDISPSGRVGVTGSRDGLLWIWDTDTGETRRVLKGHVADIETCRFFPSGLVVLSGGGDFLLRVWSVAEGGCARTLVGHKRRVTDTCIIGKGRNVISTSADGSATLWDCGRGQKLYNIATLSCEINKCHMTTDSNHGNQSAEGVMNMNQKILLLACEDGCVRAYDVEGQKEISQFSSGCGQVTSCMFINDTQFIAGGEKGQLSCYDIRYPSSDPLWKGVWSLSTVSSLGKTSSGNIAVGYRDGSCAILSAPPPSLSIECVLTGPSIDPITTILSPRQQAPPTSSSCLYTACRDGYIRQYTV